MINNIEHSYKSYSIYYNQIVWNYIILNGIMPFLKVVRNKNLFENYMLFKGVSRGDNITIVFKTTSNHTENLSKEIKKHFDSYLQEHPSKTDKIKLPLNEWLLDFPNNSLHENDFSAQRKAVQLLTGGKQTFSLINEQLYHTSELSFKVIDQYEHISQDEIIATVLELILSFVYSAGFIKQEAHLFFEFYLDHLLPKTNSTNSGLKEIKPLRRRIKQEYKANQSELSEFIHAFWDTLDKENGQISDDVLDVWILESKRFFSGLNTLKSDNKIVVPYHFKFKKKTSKENQILWPIMEYIISNLMSLLGFNDFSSRYYFIYSITISLKSGHK